MAAPQGFQGRIGRTLADSEAWFAEPEQLEDRPNVVVVLLDDTGFAQFGCYGSDIDTANIDALAADGLQFTNFHVTPLCSPTRASLLTGRSQHAVGMRSLSNFRTGFPHQLGHISNHATTMAEVFGEAGYATFCVGKWHLAPMEQGSAAGPVDQWPLARGFHRFYGFLDGETDQFNPTLVADNHPVPPPARPEDGYHLSEDLVDQLLAMIADSKGVRPDRPFFAYLPFGATHAPHQAPEAYLRKYRGAFDEGWDVARERWFARQVERGIVPPGTKLADHNPGVDAWEDLPDDQKALAARLQEAFAAFLDHTDDQIGRLVEGLRTQGQLDNTILLVLADNGASQEGGPFGVLHEMLFFNGIMQQPGEVQDRLEDIGGPHSHTNYPWGWAQAGNTPFRWYKQNTHEGGVHVPLIVHWPNGIAADQAGTLRDQFVNVADIAPTLYNLTGVSAPDVYRGLEQLPITGHPFDHVLADPGAPASNQLQYFELHGSRALVAGEWKAVCKHTPGADYDTEPWELYHLASDRSETNDLAAEHPEKLAELIDLWWSEAERHGVLPLDDRGLELFLPRFRPGSPHHPDGHYTYRPPNTPTTRLSPIPAQAGALVGGRNLDLVATVTRAVGEEGVLYATGTENSGISLFVQDDHLHVHYNAFGQHTVLSSDRPVPTGDTQVGLRLRLGTGMGGTLALIIDGRQVGAAELPLLMRVISSVGSSIGFDNGSAVSDRYRGPFPFAGALHRLDVQLDPKPAPGTLEAEAAAALANQ